MVLGLFSDSEMLRLPKLSQSGEVSTELDKTHWRRLNLEGVTVQEIYRGELR